MHHRARSGHAAFVCIGFCRSRPHRDVAENIGLKGYALPGLVAVAASACARNLSIRAAWGEIAGSETKCKGGGTLLRMQFGAIVPCLGPAIVAIVRCGYILYASTKYRRGLPRRLPPSRWPVVLRWKIGHQVIWQLVLTDALNNPCPKASPKTQKPRNLRRFGVSCGRCRTRTYDLFDVNEAR